MLLPRLEPWRLRDEHRLQPRDASGAPMVELNVFAVVGTLFGGYFVFRDVPAHTRKLNPLLAVALIWLGLAALALVRPFGYRLLALGSLMAIGALCYFRSARRNKEPVAVDPRGVIGAMMLAHETPPARTLPALPCPTVAAVRALEPEFR